MLKEIIEIIWILLPAGIANMIPVLVKKIPLMNYPLDANIKINKKPLLGKNKTWRGLISGIAIAIFLVMLQKTWDPFDVTIINYSSINPLALGFILGFGALGGDLIKSFFKRRMNKKPGSVWIPFDQLDWVIGSLILLNIYNPLSLSYNLYALVIFGILHPLTNIIGYWMGIKKNKW